MSKSSTDSGGIAKRVSRNKWIVLAVGIAALATDLLSKQWALANLDDGVRRPVLGSFLSLELIHNPGAAFSVGTGTTWIFTVVSILVLVVIVWYVATGRVRDGVVAVLIGFIAGGAAGNLFDRLVRPPGVGSGHVVDFLNYNGWFVGNVADIWIVVGVVVLVVYLFVVDQKDGKNE